MAGLALGQLGLWLALAFVLLEVNALKRRLEDKK